MRRQQGISAHTQGPGAGVPMLNGLYQAQVTGVVTGEHAVTVILPLLTALEHSSTRAGLKVLVLARRAGARGSEVDLPQVGEWGVVAFLAGTHPLAVWLGSVHQTLNNFSTGTIGERIDQHDSGVYTRIDPAGNVEWAHPSGLYVRVGSGTTLAARKRRRRKPDTTTAEIVDYSPVESPAPTVHLAHPSGATVTIETTGKVTVTSPNEIVLNGATMTHIGGASGVDFVALKSAVEKIQAAYDVHQHDSSAPPSPQVGSLIPGIDYTVRTKAT